MAGSFYSCASKDETHPEKATGEWFSNVKVKNASEFSDIVLVKLMGFDRNLDRYVELARGDWKDGSFTIVPPETLASNYLHPLISSYSYGFLTVIIDPPSTMSISNPNINVGNVQIWGFDKDDNLVAMFHQFKVDGDSNTEVVYTYVDSDVNISGYLERMTIVTEYDEGKNMDVLCEWKVNTTYFIQWKKGWNVWYHSSSNSLTERVMTEHWSSTPINGIEWNGSEEDLWKYQSQ